MSAATLKVADRPGTSEASFRDAAFGRFKTGRDGKQASYSRIVRCSKPRNRRDHGKVKGPRQLTDGSQISEGLRKENDKIRCTMAIQPDAIVAPSSTPSSAERCRRERDRGAATGYPSLKDV
jgi:hypothetical protein